MYTLRVAESVVKRFASTRYETRRSGSRTRQCRVVSMDDAECGTGSRPTLDARTIARRPRWSRSSRGDPACAATAGNTVERVGKPVMLAELCPRPRAVARATERGAGGGGAVLAGIRHSSGSRAVARSSVTQETLLTCSAQSSMRAWSPERGSPARPARNWAGRVVRVLESAVSAARSSTLAEHSVRAPEACARSVTRVGAGISHREDDGPIEATRCRDGAEACRSLE